MEVWTLPINLALAPRMCSWFIVCHIFLSLTNYWTISEPKDQLTALTNGTTNCSVPVFPVHVVGTTARIVSQPNSKVLDTWWTFLVDLKKEKKLLASLEIPACFCLALHTTTHTEKMVVLIKMFQCPQNQIQNDWTWNKSRHELILQITLSCSYYGSLNSAH